MEGDRRHYVDEETSNVSLRRIKEFSTLPCNLIQGVEYHGVPPHGNSYCIVPIC